MDTRVGDEVCDERYLRLHEERGDSDNSGAA